MAHTIRFGGVYPLTKTPSRPLAERERHWVNSYERGNFNLEHKLIAHLCQQGRIQEGLGETFHAHEDDWTGQPVLLTNDSQGNHIDLYLRLQKEKIDPIREQLAQLQERYNRDEMDSDTYQTERRAINTLGVEATRAMNDTLLSQAQEALKVTYTPTGNFNLTLFDKDDRDVRFDKIEFVPLPPKATAK